MQDNHGTPQLGGQSVDRICIFRDYKSLYRGRTERCVVNRKFIMSHLRGRQEITIYPPDGLHQWRMGVKCTFLYISCISYYFISLIVLLPLLDPSLDAVNVGFHLIGLVARQLNDNLAVKGVTRLLQQHFHNFRVEVLLQLGLGIISARG